MGFGDGGGREASEGEGVVEDAGEDEGEDENFFVGAGEVVD